MGNEGWIFIELEHTRFHERLFFGFRVDELLAKLGFVIAH
jgi:hypothetical protein